MNEFIKYFDELKISSRNFKDPKFPPNEKSVG